jgi:hypothetical protein
MRPPTAANTNSNHGLPDFHALTAPIAEYSRLTLGLPRQGTCERMPRFCAAA